MKFELLTSEKELHKIFEYHTACVKIRTKITNTVTELSTIVNQLKISSSGEVEDIIIWGEYDNFLKKLIQVCRGETS